MALRIDPTRQGDKIPTFVPVDPKDLKRVAMSLPRMKRFPCRVAFGGDIGDFVFNSPKETLAFSMGYSVGYADAALEAETAIVEDTE